MKKWLEKWWPYLGIALGFLIIFIFPFMEWTDAMQRQKIIDSLVEQTEQLDTDALEEYRTQAVAFNQSLAGLDTEIPPREIWPYEQQLAVDGPSGPMSYLFVPKLGLHMPIYHTTSQAVLSMGVGHVENTSLPVGGESTHCVLSAHSGLVEMTGFDEIHQLEKGDIIGVQTLGQWYCYEVQDQKVIQPDETEYLRINKGEDMLTLLTCTPYGVNTERLLVNAVRCEVPADFAATRTDVTTVVKSIRTVPLILGLSLIVITLIMVWLINLHKKRKKNVQ